MSLPKRPRALTLAPILLSIVSLFTAASAIAADDAPEASADGSFAAGQAAFAAGDFATALDRFVAARDAGVSGPAVSYNIAVCQYRLGLLDAAEQSFSMLAERYPAMADLAGYNIGLIHLARGEEESARVAFERAAETADPTLRDLARVALARIGTPPATPGRLNAYVDLGAGHDSNVVLLEDSVLPAGQQSGSDFVELLGFVSATPGTAEAWRLDATGYAASYADVSGLDQTAIAVSVLRSIDGAVWHVDVGPAAGMSWLDGDGFERRLGIAIAADRAVGAATTLRFRLNADDVDSASGRFDYVAGSRRLLQAGLIRYTTRGRLAVDLSFESNARADAAVSPDRRRLVFGYRLSLGAAWAADLSLMLRDSDYRDLAVVRHESLREIGFIARRDLGRGWQLSAGARIADNGSTDPIFEYSRTRLTVGINRSFRGER